MDLERVARHLLMLAASLAAAACAAKMSEGPEETVAIAPGASGWEVVGGGHDNIKYSPLEEIDTGNVHRLVEAWRHDTGDGFSGSEMQTNPIVIGGLLYAVTPKQRLIALDAATGALAWRFDPHDGKEYGGPSRNRGVAYWADGTGATIFYAVRHWLYAIDAQTGRPKAAFGDKGRIDMRAGLGRDPETVSVSATSPGVVYKDLLIIGSSLAEDLPAAPGDIRAYDVHSGELRWTFRTIPAAGEAGAETWPEGARERSGGANSWSGLSLDLERGIVFAPTGSAAFDFWGGDRPGDNLYANSLIALNARTGERIWHFQFIRHDVWDRDLPTPPSLVTVQRAGKRVAAVAQITKSGLVYLFDRETGKPLAPIGETATPASPMVGEQMAASQPYPSGLPPFSRTRFDASQVTNRSPDARAAVLEQLKGLRFGHPFEPPSREGTVIFPGLDGGGEWGGAAFDPHTGLLYVNSNEMAWLLRLLDRPQPTDGVASARELYQTNCASCHGTDMRGTPSQFPSLHDVRLRMTAAEVERTIRHGAARMPAFAELGDDAVRALTHYLMTGVDRSAQAGTVNRLPFRLEGYQRLLDPDGYPIISPPWGQLTAIDLNRGKIAWQVPFGEIPALRAQGLTNTGSENYGGPVVTAGGLLFIAATTMDRKIRAFDKRNGRLLWEAKLPFSGTATPAVYRAGDRQYLVVASGGGKSGQPSGGVYVAYALPKP